MRSAEEILDVVLRVAKEDDRVRAVAMNGSRTNANVPKDPFRDFDIVYLVTDMHSFINDPNWIDVFGERIIMQTPENMSLFPAGLGGRFTYLMLFADGNRIDLMLIPIEEKDTYSFEDSLTVLLLDKDQQMPAIPDPTDEGYWIKRPSAEFFADCCNEFWWTSTYIVKGLWRQEILYAYEHFNIVRSMLLKMIEWKVGVETEFSLSIGKNGKFLKRYVSQEIWGRLLKTYPSGDYDSIWCALYIMVNLFEEVAMEVATHFDYFYPMDEANKVKQYHQQVQMLYPNATEIY